MYFRCRIRSTKRQKTPNKLLYQLQPARRVEVALGLSRGAIIQCVLSVRYHPLMNFKFELEGCL